MRMTNNMLISNMMGNLSTNLVKTSKYQTQLATGKKIEIPSDDPIVAAKSLKLRTDVAEIAQYKRNTDDATSWMEVTESTIGQMGDVQQRFRELVVQASNGTNTTEDMQKIASEVEQLKTQMTQLANATYSGRYVFSGYKTDQKLMDENGNFLIDVTNAETIRYEIGIGDDVEVNVAGSDLFHGGANAVTGTQSTFIATFDQALTAMNAGDNNALSALLTAVDSDQNNLLRVQSALGARMNRVELSANRLEDDNVGFTSLMSKNEDVDIAEAIMNLKNETNVYQASLSTSAKVIQNSLVDFLS